MFVDDDGEPFTTSLVIAVETSNQHKNVLELIHRNLDDLNEVGRVAFQTRPFETAGGTQRREVAELDEPAAALLMTYLRNSPVVKDFKKRLVAGFYALRQQLAERSNVVALPDRRALAQMVIEAEDRADREAAARAEAEARAKELEAPASAWQHMASSQGDYMVRDAAKVLSRDPNIEIGQQRLFKFMQAEGWIYRENGAWKPYQTQIQTGRLAEKLNRPFLNERTGEMEVPAPSVRITPKGLAELHKRLGGSGQLAAVAAS
ncbi:phage regulatory protein/antirepressor Ant [Mycolicibacterium fortuitum]|uniref:phage regulatory protein/antirepressor Ant n=1 Tax=Mycolicibacterium fortuitum TaxID=1766 RepID=UPI0027DE6CC5|nr:phage regulatory protein/antirepressor Ant [Mycolicibacterium fortuitum]